MASTKSDHKWANTDYNIHELFKKRWSPRAFSDKRIERDMLRQLFDAARWAPSSYNEQPWRFIAATKDQPKEYERLSRVMNEKNRAWATSAPLLCLTLAKNDFEKFDRPNKHALHDVGQAISYFTIEAMRHDIYVHQMAGILPDKAYELFHISEHYTPVTMVAAGYIGDPEDLPENFQKMERAKRNR